MPDWTIKYVYKGELLTADEFIKAQDEIIQDLKKQITQRDGLINVLNWKIKETMDKLNEEAKENENLKQKIQDMKQREIKKHKVVVVPMQHLQHNK